MSDIRQFTPVVLLQLSRIVRQGLSLCTAKIVFFRKCPCLRGVSCVVVSGLRSWGNGGEVPILDKLESFVVNSFWLVAGRFFE